MHECKQQAVWDICCDNDDLNEWKFNWDQRFQWKR